MSWQQTIEALEVLGLTVDADLFRTKEVFESTFSVQDFTPETMAVVMNRASVISEAANTSRPGRKRIRDVRRGFDVDFITLVRSWPVAVPGGRS